MTWTPGLGLAEVTDSPPSVGMDRVRLPGGLWHEGRLHSNAWVRPVVGFDEEAMLDSHGDPVADRATTLLNRCTRIDGIDDALSAVEAAQALSIGDREFLIWHIRRRTRGDTVDAVVNCSSCDEKLDVSVTVDQLLHGAYEYWPASHTETLAGTTVEFVVPTGAMQQAVALRAIADPVGAAAELLQACIIAIDGAVPTGPLPEAVSGELIDRFAELDPQAEALFEILCPHCDAGTTSVLDAGGHFLEEIEQRSRFLYREVHTLAWYYHWSEHDILALDPRKRRRYLALISESTGGGGL